LGLALVFVAVDIVPSEPGQLMNRLVGAIGR
jgi:hypothetical protein